MKYLRLFKTTAAYDAAKNDLDLANVSYIDETRGVEFNPWFERRVIATFNVTSTSDPTKILDNTAYFSTVEIDGVEQPSVVDKYTFLTTGEHTIKYTLKDPTSINNNVFLYCTGLTNVTIPNSVTSIGLGAFQGCSSLTNITIPSSVTSIGARAFANCSGFTSVTIPKNVTNVGNAVFSGCPGLTSILVDGANTYYDSRNNCNAIINTSTNELIAGCKNTVIPNTVTSIGDYAFDNCSGLTNITIPSSVTNIGQNAFNRCTGLTSIIIPNSVTSIGEGAFINCMGLTSITIGSSITSISRLAFASCSSLTSITIPDTVTDIGNDAFSSCSNLTRIVIGNGVTSIGKEAFRYCSNLTSVTIGRGVTSIGSSAFEKCTKLVSVACYATTAPTIQHTTFINVKNYGTLTVPSGSIGYDVWMGTDQYYLGYYNWTKVEQ